MNQLACVDRIGVLSKLSHDWDALGSPAPSTACLSICYVLIDVIHNRQGAYPDKINPSCDGGISFIWFNNDDYSSLEVENDGSIICGRNINDKIEVYEGNLYDSLSWIWREYSTS